MPYFTSPQRAPTRRLLNSTSAGKTRSLKTPPASDGRISPAMGMGTGAGTGAWVATGGGHCGDENARGRGRRGSRVPRGWATSVNATLVHILPDTDSIPGQHGALIDGTFHDSRGRVPSRK